MKKWDGGAFLTGRQTGIDGRRYCGRMQDVVILGHARCSSIAPGTDGKFQALLAEVAVNRAQHLERKKMQGPRLNDRPSQRVASIDALRGFDMFWIIGGDALFRGLHPVFHHPTTAWISQQLTHVAWQGFHFYDLIFPLFLFLAGTALPFSLARRQERGESRGRLHLYIAKRAAVLIGMNPITIYFLQAFVDFGRISSFFLVGVSQYAGILGPLILASGALLAKWLLLWFLYRHRIFFRA